MVALGAMAHRTLHPSKIADLQIAELRSRLPRLARMVFGEDTPPAEALLAQEVAGGRAASTGAPKHGLVLKVIDGDTLTLSCAGRKRTCRLLGIDAPENSYSGLFSDLESISKYVVKPKERRDLAVIANRLGVSARRAMEKARAATAELCKLVDGKRVRLEYDTQSPAKDEHGRLLAYVSLVETGLDVNAEMVRRGFAVADKRFKCSRLAEYGGLARQAQLDKAGIWRK